MHVALGPLTNASRMLKESATLVTSGVAERVFLVGLHQGELPRREELTGHREIVRIALRSRGLSRGLASQMIKYVEFAIAVFRLARAEKCTVFNVHNVALLPIGVGLKWLVGGRLVYDAHELETEVDGLQGLRKWLAKVVERGLIRFCDLTIVVSPSIERWYRIEYRLGAIVTVLNAPHFSEVRRTTLLRVKLGIPADLKIVLYQGGLARGRGIDVLLAAAPALREAGYALVFMGYGELQYAIEAAQEGHDNVYFLPAVPPDDVLSYTASADIGVHPIRLSSMNHDYCLPNKLFEYVMAGLPVVVSDLTEMGRFVRETEVGVAQDSWNSDNLIHALAKVEALRGPDMDNRIRSTARQYSWENQEPRLVAAYRMYVLGRMAR